MQTGTPNNVLSGRSNEQLKTVCLRSRSRSGFINDRLTVFEGIKNKHKNK